MSSPKLTKRSKELVERFSEAAQAWGYAADQWNGSEVDDAKANFEATKEALEFYIEELQAKNRRMTTRLRVDPHNNQSEY